MARNEAFEWMKIATATMTLAWESAGVVGLRAFKAAKGGPNAADEADVLGKVHSACRVADSPADGDARRYACCRGKGIAETLSPEGHRQPAPAQQVLAALDPFWTLAA